MKSNALSCTVKVEKQMRIFSISLSHLMVVGMEIILAASKSVLFIDSVVVVLYDPEMLSW